MVIGTNFKYTLALNLSWVPNNLHRWFIENKIFKHIVLIVLSAYT